MSTNSRLLKQKEEKTDFGFFFFCFIVMPQKMCQCLRAHWKDNKAMLHYLGSNWLAQVVNILALAQCFSYSFSYLTTAHLDTSYTGMEIRVTRKRQSKQKIGHDAAVQMHSLYGSDNIASLSTHPRDSTKSSGKHPVPFYLSLPLSVGSPSSLGIARMYLPLSA